MSGARHQVVETQAMQQFVDAGQRVNLAEALFDFLPQDRSVVCRQRFLRTRSGIEHFAHFLLLLNREFGDRARLPPGNQCTDAPIAIAADPLIHELPCAMNRRGDLIAIQFGFIPQPFTGDEYNAIAIALFGIGFSVNQFPQPLRICWIFPIDYHGKPPCKN